MNRDSLEGLAARLGAELKSRGLMLVTAESCTGGWIGEAVTSIAGSSEWYDRGFIAYSNPAKGELLGVLPETLARHGAVSEAAVLEMAQGALDRSQAQWSVAVSGIAGPAGGTAEKPVGTVCLAWAGRGQAPVALTRLFAGDRQSVRRQTVVAALAGLLDLLAGKNP